MGYGLWVYRNYVNNAVYNSQFALDQEGWSFSGDSRIEERNGSKAAVIGKKGSISQDLDGRIPGSSRIHVEFYAEAENGGASVTVRLGGDEQTIHVGEGKTYRMEFESLPRYTFSITAERRIHVDDIRVYTYEQDGRIYERDGSAGDLAGDFRTLNGELAAGSAPAGGMAAGTPGCGRGTFRTAARGNDGRRSAVCRRRIGDGRGMELTGEKKDWGRGMAEAFSMVKDQAPLVHMIANYVTGLLLCRRPMAAMGARPLMAQAPEEMEEITGSAGRTGSEPGPAVGRKISGL